jgi:hypothetical protein
MAGQRRETLAILFAALDLGGDQRFDTVLHGIARTVSAWAHSGSNSL